MPWFDWILNYLRKLFPDSLQTRGNGPMSVMIGFIGGLIRSWYMLIAVPAIILAYKTLKILAEKGILAKAQAIVETAINSAFHIVNDCLPLILNFSQMMRCVLV